MANSTAALIAFNRGRISQLALARTDFKRTALSSEVQTNWIPRELGSMMLRPGLGFLGATKSNAAAITIPFVKAFDDVARIELTDSVMRVWVDDRLVTRPSVSTAISNGTFGTDLTGWSDQDGGTATSAWATGGYMSLTGDGNSPAKRRQTVTVSGADINKVHALSIAVTRGPVYIRVGSSAGDDDYVGETVLGTGFHSLAFTPTGTFYIDLYNFLLVQSLVDSIVVAPAGTMEVSTPWTANDLSNIRWDQSGDIVFCACDGVRQHKIERRDNESWSCVVYQSDNGPFMVENVGPITMGPSATTGIVTITASQPYFSDSQVGALISIRHDGQTESADISAQDTFTDPIRVTGVGSTRAFSLFISGLSAGTVTLQYSVGDVGDWVDAASGTFTADTAESYNDNFDNQVIYYRLGIKSGGYVSGTITCTMIYGSGSQTGIARILSVSSSTQVSAGVISAFGKAGTASSAWSESYWSEKRGYPTSVAFYEGRLWWAWNDRIAGSVSDAFYDFDETTLGDSGPINRSIGSGPVAKIYWLFPGQRLLLGTAGAIWSARSSTLDEPLTPTNFNLKAISTQGAANVTAVKNDTAAVFIHRCQTRIYEAAYEPTTYDYAATELSVHIPEIGEPAIVRSVVQYKPEVRVHHVRSDGTVAVQVYDKVEDINCFIDIETAGEVEDVCVLPGTIEDQVYYIVKRTINGSTVRYHEKWAMESECVGGTLNKQGDAFIAVSGSGASITGLDHLEGENVVCWVDGKDMGSFTVSSGTIAQSYTTGAVVGLPYSARYKSVKLAYGAMGGETALTQKKKVTQLGVIARNMHYQGLRHGPDFDTLDDLPLVESYAETDADTIWTDYDAEPFTFAGNWASDSRLCLQACAPRPVTLLAAIVMMEENPK